MAKMSLKNTSVKNTQDTRTHKKSTSMLSKTYSKTPLQQTPLQKSSLQQAPSQTPSQILSQKEAQRRQQILQGDMLKVIFSVSLPLVFYTSLDQVFKFFDTLIAANMSSSVISTVAFVSQIQTMLCALGAGLALGGAIIIARYYGAGDMKEVKKNISTLFFLCLFIALALLAIFVPFCVPFLRLLKMPQDLLLQGSVCFVIEVCALSCVFINSIFIAIQKARGSTKSIMWYNIMVFATKTTLNLFFAYILHKGVVFLSVSTLAAQGLLTVVAIVNLTNSKNPFRISFKACSWTKKTLLPIITLSFPIFLGKFVFAFGKVIVNTMCATFGSTVIGALGVSNRIGALSSNPATGFQDGESPLISQNLGANNTKRALGIFYRTLLINLVLASICFILTGIFKKDLISLFARGDLIFAKEIEKIYTYERLDAILVSVNASVMGLLYGFGKTKISMLLNGFRLFLFRIPTLWLFMWLPCFSYLGTRAVGIAMLTSNCLTGVCAGAFAFVLIKRLKK